MPPIHELFVGAALLLGAFLMVVAAVGLIRFPDIYCRMHAAGKASTLGMVLVLVAAVTLLLFAAESPQWSMAVRGVLAIVFQFLTIPTATHLLARAAYVREYPLAARTALDELKDFLPTRPDCPEGKE